MELTNECGLGGWKATNQIIMVELQYPIELIFG
jgi:hypothetical protein